MAASATARAASPQAATAVPRLSHVFLIMEENNGFHDVIGNKAAPNLNYLASTFGVETHYFGVSPCCSESNYVQLLGGTSYPSVNSDDAYWKNVVAGQPSLITQLDHAGVSWKAYLQSLPYAGFSSFYGLAAKGGQAWAVGEYLNRAFQDRALVEAWNGHAWSIADVRQPGSQRDMMFGASAVSPPAGDVWTAGEADSPAGGGQPFIVSFASGHGGTAASATGWTASALPKLPDGANWSNLYGIAVAGGSAWADGTYVDPATDNNNALMLRESGGTWSVVDVPNPGSGSNLPGALANIGGHLWLSGVYDDGAAGSRWSRPANS